MEDKLLQLHTNLIKKGYTLPDYEIFKVDMSDSTKSSELHKNLLAKGFTLPDYDTFVSDLGLKKKDETISETSQTSSEEQQPLPPNLQTPDVTLETPELGPKENIPNYLEQGKNIERPRQTTVAGDLLRTFKATGLRILGGMAAAPMVINRSIAAYTLRPIIKAMGGTDEEAEYTLNALTSGTTLGQGMLTTEQAQKPLNKAAQKAEEKMAQISGGIASNLFRGKDGEKDVAAGFEQLGRTVVGAIPYSILTAATAGAGSVAVLGTIGATAAAQQYAETEGMAEGKRVLNSWMYGGFEGLGEALSAIIFRGIGQAFRSGVKKTISETTAKSFAKGVAGAVGLESSSEVITQIGQNFTAIVTGEDPKRGLFDGVLDVAISGAAFGLVLGGGGHAGASILGRTIASDTETKQVQDNFNQQKVLIEQLDLTDSDPVKNALKKSIKDLKFQADEIMDTNYELAKKLSPEEQGQVAELYTVWNELQGKIDNNEVTEQEAPAIENTIKGIKDQIQTVKDNLVTRLEEEAQAEKDAKIEEVKKAQETELDKLAKEKEKKTEKIKDVKEGETVNKKELEKVKETYDTKTEEVKSKYEEELTAIQEQPVEAVQKEPVSTEREQVEEIEQKKKEVPQELKPIKKTKVRSRTDIVSNIVPNSFEESTMQYILKGGTISREDFKRYTGWSENDINASGLGFILTKKGAKLDVFHEFLESSFGMEDKGAMDMINAVTDILMKYHTRGAMLNELERRQGFGDRYEPTQEEIAKQEKDERLTKIIAESGGFNETAINMALKEGLINKEDYKLFISELENENTEREQESREWTEEEARVESERGIKKVSPSKGEGRGKEVKPKAEQLKEKEVEKEGIKFKDKTYSTIDEVNEDFDNGLLTFSEQNKAKQLLRESDFDKLEALPRTDNKEELAFDSPLPMDSREDPNFQSSDLNNAMSLRNIARNLITNMGLKEGAQVRIGRVKKFARKAQGLYFLDNSIMRIGSNTDLRVLTHELGHYIDHYLFNMRGVINTRNYKDVVTASRIKDAVLRDIELEKLKTKYGDVIVSGVLQRNSINRELDAFLKAINYPKSQRKRTEGLAEFIYNYIVDSPSVIKQTPSLYSWFEKLLDNAEPIKNAIQQARKSYDLYKQQDPRAIIESHVSRDKEDNGFIAGIKKLTKDKIVYSLIDNTIYAEKLAKIWRDAKEGKAESANDPFLALKGMLGIEGKVHQWLVYHPYFKKGNDIELKKDIDGLLKVLKPIIGTEKFKGYEDYLIARRDVESYDNGKPQFAIEKESISREAVKLFEEQYGKKELEEFQGELQAYSDALLDFALASEKISQEAYDKIKELNRYYVPFKRIFEDYELNKGAKLTKEMLASSASPIKARKGSKRQLISPFESMIRNTYDIIKSSERNIANRNMADALEDIQKYNLKHGESKGLIQEIPSHSIKPYFDVKTQEVRWGLTKEAPKGKIIAVWREGKPKYYEVAPEYYDVLYQNEAKVNEIIRVLSTPSRWLQAGAVVYDPTFPLRNIPRDQTSAWFYSNYNYMPTDFIRGISSAIKKDDIFQKWLASGADQSFLVASDQMLEKDYVNKKIGRNLKRKFDTYKRNPLLFLQDFSRASEMGTRIGAFKNAYKKTGDTYKAMQESRDISADYGIHGAAMRQIAPMYPFLNARTQHAKMEVRAMKNAGKFLLRGLAISAPAMLIWLLNNKDDESKDLYQSLPTWRRVGLWNIRIPGTDHFFPIPKGFFGVLFGSSTESFLDFAFKEDDRIVKELPSQLFKEFSPLGNITEIVPFPIRPQIEVWANKKGYTGKSIIPEAYKDLKPEQQYFDTTPEIFKEISKAIGISPLKMEHYIRSYFGGAGIGAINILDETLQAIGIVEEKPEDTFTTLSKMPVFKAILTERPIGSYSGYVTDFYSTLDKIAGINKQVNKYISTDQQDKLDKYLSDPKIEALYKFYIGNETSMNNFKYLLSQTRDLKYAVMKDDLMDNAQKQETIRNIDDIIQRVALKFKDAFDNKSFFDLGAETKDILKDIKEKKSEIRQSMEIQKNLYNPYWLQVKDKDKEVFNILKNYDGFQDLSLPKQSKELEENELRIFKERLITNYVAIVKETIGTDKKIIEQYKKEDTSTETKKKTELDDLFTDAWIQAINLTQQE